MTRLNHSRRLFWVLNGLLFVLLWLCNTLTLICVDDFNYHFSYKTWTLLKNVFEILPSMAAHYQMTNGRVVAHAFVQLFEFLPKPIFNVVNSLVFLVQLHLIYRIALGKNENNNLLFLGIFSAVWVFSPGFGEANLWLDGACNYLWSILVCLLFIMPFLRWYLSGAFLSGGKYVCFLVFSLFAGAYSENASSAALFMAVCFLLAGRFLEHNKIPFRAWFPIAAAVVGYLFMALAPGERANKGLSMTFGLLRSNFITCLEMVREWWPLLAVLVVGVVLCFTSGKDTRKIVIAVVLFLGAMVSSFIFTAAAYYPIRAASCSTVLLTTADAVLLYALLPERKELVNCLLAVMILCSSYWVLFGVNDIYVTYYQMRDNEAHILDCRDRGVMDVEIKDIHAETKYSAIYQLLYINCQDVTEWPNASMARYYGVQSVIGVP